MDNKNSMPQFEQIERTTTLSEKVFEIIKSHIMRNDIIPGTVLNARDLSEQLGVSMTPVREALILLEHAGWIEQRGKNKVVVLPSPQELFDYAEVRVTLELLAFHLTKDRICPEWIAEMRQLLLDAAEYNYQQDGINYGLVSTKFHLYLAKKSGNQYLYNTLSEILDHTFRSSIMRNKKNNQVRITTLENHERLVTLLEAERWKDYETELPKHIRLWAENTEVPVTKSVRYKP